MEHKFRAAIWAAVSKDEQVQDKASIPSYESGAYTVEEFAAKRKAYKAREAELLDAERQKAEAARRTVERAEVVVRMRDLIPYLPAWLAEQDPATVRFHLSRAVRMIVHPDKTVEVSLL